MCIRDSSFVAWLSHLIIDHASLSRRSTVPTPSRDTAQHLWALVTFSFIYNIETFCFISFPPCVAVGGGKGYVVIGGGAPFESGRGFVVVVNCCCCRLSLLIIVNVSAHRTDQRFPGHDLHLPDRTDVFLICRMQYNLHDQGHVSWVG